MRIACISDIHGNIYALNKVLENIEENNIDQIICLGDLTGYGPHPNEVVALIRRRKILCLKGNYDASVVENKFSYIRETDINSFSLPWTVDELRASHKFYLESLPEKLTLTFEEKSILLVHGSPRSINQYLHYESLDAEEIMQSIREDVLVCAHTHIPYVKQYENKLLINDGSVGKPKIGRPNATYVILDMEKNRDIKIEMKEVSYDILKTVKDMEMKNFPTKLVYSIKSGNE